MKVFNGTYFWDGKKHGNREPIAWFPGAYNLRIFQLTAGHRDITYLKPYLCIFATTGYGLSISARPEKFAQNICRDFSLELDRTLWVEEIDEETGRYEVITFTPSGRLGTELFYQVSKRPPSAAELRLIRKELVGLSH